MKNIQSIIIISFCVYFILYYYYNTIPNNLNKLLVFVKTNICDFFSDNTFALSSRYSYSPQTEKSNTRCYISSKTRRRVTTPLVIVKCKYIVASERRVIKMLD